MENLQELIQLTVSGTFTRKNYYDFADFLGYRSMIEVSPTESIANPLNKIEYVQKHIKGLLINELSSLVLNQAKEQAITAMETQVSQVEQTLFAELDTKVSIDMSII
jgi:hypothetical protein